MPYEEAHESPELRAWLIATLEPMCDADPEVMADYIIALLKHDATFSEQEWKDFCARELSDFLEANSVPFVNALFDTLRTRSYLPAATAPAPEPIPASVPASIPTPQPQSSYRPTASTPVQPAAEQPQAGPSSPRRAEQNGEQNGEDVSMDEKDTPTSATTQPARQKCYDYHEKGYCMRGASCPYEHSPDVIIPTPQMMFQQFPFIPGGPRGHGGRGGMRGRGRGRGGMQGMPMPGFAPPPIFPFGPGAIPSPNHHSNGDGYRPDQPSIAPFPPFPMPGMPLPFVPPFQQSGPISQDSEYFGSNKPPSDRTSTTLVITDIPKSKLTVPAIREHFLQFGEITNVAIEGRSSRALISFATNQQAYQAWKSDTPVFDSRKVKVLWHRPRPGQGGAGLEALEASKNLLENMKKMETEDLQNEVKPQLKGPESRLKATLAELENVERRSKKEKLIAEQKVLLNKAATGSQEEKVAIVARLKALMKELEELKREPVVKADDVSLSEKDKLDRELEKHGMETSAGKDQDELLKLSAQLSALRDKASTLGIPETRYSPYSSRGAPRGSIRGSRARGRGRGSATFPPRPMRLDNRSRTVLVTGDFTSDEASQQVKGWYESTGGSVTAADHRSGILVNYPTRELAEKALSLGTGRIGLTEAKNVSATWYTVPAGSAVRSEGSGEVEMVDEDSRRGEDMDDD